MNRETAVVVGGKATAIERRENVVSLERTIATRSSICADCSDYSVCTEEDCLYVSGGYNSALSSESKVQEFCSTTGRWTDLPDMLEARDGHGSVCLNSKLYIIGGLLAEMNQLRHRFNTINVLDTHARYLSWDYCTEMPEALSEPGIAVVRNQILVLGGYTGRSLSNTVLSYNPATDTWTQCQPIPKPAYYYHQTAAVGNKVYMGSYDMSFFLQYDVPSDQWMDIKNPVKPTKYYALVSHQERILALGGYQNGDRKDYVQSYDPSSKVWRMERQTLPIALNDHWAAVLAK